MYFTLTACYFGSKRLHELRKLYKIGSRLTHGRDSERPGSIPEMTSLTVLHSSFERIFAMQISLWRLFGRIGPYLTAAWQE